MSQILRVFDARTSDLGEATEEMKQCGWELVTPDEPTIFTKPLLDAMVMKNSQSNGRLADSTGTNESDW